jgi:hypothetical protein
MTGEDYSRWSADDSYVVEFIKQSLGFSDVAKPPVTEITITETHVETPVETTITETPVETTITETPVETL